MRVRLATLLVSALVLGLSGCGSDESKTQDAVKSQKEINAQKDKNWQD